jgi:hypothetical protein
VLGGVVVLGLSVNDASNLIALLCARNQARAGADVPRVLRSRGTSDPHVDLDENEPLFTGPLQADLLCLLGPLRDSC